MSRVQFSPFVLDKRQRSRNVLRTYPHGKDIGVWGPDMNNKRVDFLSKGLKLKIFNHPDNSAFLFVPFKSRLQRILQLEFPDRGFIDYKSFGRIRAHLLREISPFNDLHPHGL